MIRLPVSPLSQVRHSPNFHRRLTTTRSLINVEQQGGGTKTRDPHSDRRNGPSGSSHAWNPTSSHAHSPIDHLTRHVADRVSDDLARSTTRPKAKSVPHRSQNACRPDLHHGAAAKQPFARRTVARQVPASCLTTDEPLAIRPSEWIEIRPRQSRAGAHVRADSHTYSARFGALTLIFVPSIISHPRLTLPCAMASRRGGIPCKA